MKMKIHYGWIVCVGCTLLMLCCSGMVINAFSAYLPFLVEKYGLTQTEASMISTVRSFASLIFKFIVLWFINRLGARKTMLLGALCTFTSFVCYAFGNSLFTIYLASALTGAGYGMATMVPISIVLNKWFEKNLAIAVAVCASSTGVSAMIFPAMITNLVQRFGLSTIFFGQSVLILALCLAAFFLIRNTPEEKGMEAYGHGDLAKDEKKKNKRILTNIELTGLHKILFYIAPLFLGAITVTVPSLFTLHFTSLGYDKMTAAMGVSVYGFTMLLGKFAYGIIDEILGNEKNNYLFIVILSAGTLLGCFAEGSYMILLVSSGLIGLGCALMTVGITMWAKDFSSQEGYAGTIRIYQVLTMVGSLMVSPLAGMIADKVGNYIPVFAMFTVMGLIMLLVIFSGYRVGAKKINV